MLKMVFENRKDLVNAVAEFTEQRAEYLGAPSFAYKVGNFIIDKDGCIISDSEMGTLKNFLFKKGFIHQETKQKPKQLIESKANQQESLNGVDFSVPLNGADKQAVINFVSMIYSKQYLINKALETSVIEISDDFISAGGEIDFDKISGFRISYDSLVFTYPDINSSEKLKAYMTLVCMAFAKAKECKRVKAVLSEPENEKYYMRVWLIRIGLGGKGGAETRKTLLKSLKGHSAFRTEAEIEKAKEKYKQKKGL